MGTQVPQRGRLKQRTGLAAGETVNAGRPVARLQRHASEAAPRFVDGLRTEVDAEKIEQDAQPNNYCHHAEGKI